MIWSPAMISVARSCRYQWALRYGIPRPAAPLPQEFNTPPSRPPLPARMGTLAHTGMEAAYLAAQHAVVALAGSRMELYERNALFSMNGAALGLDLKDQDVFEVQDDVVRTLCALPAPMPGSVLAVEGDLEALLPSGRRMRGRVDLILKTGRRTEHIRDWKRKRAKALPQPDDLLTDDALGFYAYARYRQNPDMLITVGLYSLRDQMEISRQFPFEAAWAKACEFDRLIDSLEADELLLPTPRGGNCTSCPVRAACPMVREL